MRLRFETLLGQHERSVLVQVAPIRINLHGDQGRLTRNNEVPCRDLEFRRAVNL